MEDFGWKLSDLLFKLKLKQDRIDSLESGEDRVRLLEKHRQELAYQDRIIKEKDRIIAKLKRKITENRKNWEQVYDDVYAECNKIIAEKDRIISDQANEIASLKQDIIAAKADANEARKEKYQAQTELADALEKMASLEAKLKKDFTNSSKPSSQTPNHKTIPNGRKKTGKNPGGQPGHEHHGRKRQKNAKEVILPAPNRVQEDPDRYVLTGKEVRKQLISAHLVVTATDYVAKEYRDTITGEIFHADFPEGIVDDVTYDPTVKGMAFVLNNECDVSIGKTKRFLSNISGGALELSTGAISNFTDEFAKKSKEDIEEIKRKILSSGISHADFTFGRKQGKMSTVLIMTNDEAAAYQSVSAKGNAGVEEAGLKNYSGTLVSDHEAAFVNLNCNHQECMAHTLRYAIGSVENEPDLNWNKLFVVWDRKSIQHWRTYDPSTAEQWHTVSDALIQEFITILKIAKEQYDYEPPGKYYKEGFNLYSRMAESPDDYILFLKDPKVPPTNNAAEQKARVYKRKAHQVMSFRGAHGEERYCDCLTILETAKMQNRNVYDEVTSIFDTIVVRQRKRSPNLTTLQKMRNYVSDPNYWIILSETN